ncbi:hypothetical protein HY625_02350 [Candidatus Uhrbacteria bacterium]|nr:hypothetical protein [Candidatus Uhrbacteria bacterium]
MTSSFTTAAVSGGSGGGTGPAASVGVTPPAPVVVPVVPVVVNEVRAVATAIVQDVSQLISLLKALGLTVARDVKAETAAAKSALADAKEFKVTLSAGVNTVVANFIAYGTSGATAKLGSGERRAVTRDAFDTLGDVANNSDKLLTFIEEIANGKKPSIRNLSKENKQVPAALKLFQQLTGKAKPDFKNAKEDLAWNTLQYRVRFPRDLNAEKVGIARFKKVTGLTPKTTLQWAAVRAYGYVIAK